MEIKKGVPTLQEVSEAGSITNNQIGLGTITSPTYQLEIGCSDNGIQVSTTTSGGNLAHFGGEGDFSIDYPASPGGRLMVKDSGNIGIGQANPDTSSKLEIASTTQGFLPPRMTTAEKNAISSPATGLMVFDTTLGKLCVYTGAAWETITSA